MRSCISSNIGKGCTPNRWPKTKFEKAFPEIAKLAKTLLEYAKTNKPNLSLDFDEIDKIDNRYLNSNLPAILASYKLEKILKLENM